MNLFFVALAIAFLSCQQRKTSDTGESDPKADYFEPGKEYVHMIPDSLRTAEQQAAYDKLKKELPGIVAEHVVVEDSLLVFKMTRDEFAEIGLPDPYYDLIVKDLENINAFSSSGKFGGQSIDEIWDNGKRYNELMEQNAGESNE